MISTPKPLPIIAHLLHRECDFPMGPLTRPHHLPNSHNPLSLCWCDRFVESEIELNEVLQEMHVLATVPDYFSIITELNTIQSLLHLLSHENTDISIAVVDLVQVMYAGSRGTSGTHQFLLFFFFLTWQ